MAIDSREKRQSLIGITYFMGVSTSPESAKDQEWRQATGFGYSGILSEESILWTIQVNDTTSWAAQSNATTIWTDQSNDSTAWIQQ